MVVGGWVGDGVMGDGLMGSGYWMDTKEITGHRVDIMMSEAHLKCHQPRISA